MLSRSSLKPKQEAAVGRLFEHDQTILVAPTGEGKTVICLTAINDLIEAGAVTKVIVACPAKVVGVWGKELTKWSHLSKLTAVTLSGGPLDRTRTREMNPTADILVVSLNNLESLLLENHGADGVIIDELSKAAGKQTAKLKSKKYAARIKWRVGMTATPVSQSFEKLFAMVRIVDGGQALGTSKARYLETYFNSDYMGYNFTLRDGADEQIMEKVAGLVHLIEDTKHETLPAITYTTTNFLMPADTRSKYDDMKKHMVAEDIEAANAAVQSGKLRQIASGFLYGEDDTVEVFDDARFRQAKDWASRLGQRKGIIFYEYVKQYEALSALPNSTSEVATFIGSPSAKLLIAQINSLSHGVDGLQDVCHQALFYQPVWSRDAMEQAVGRLWRTGQRWPVTITTLSCDKTLDALVTSRVEGNAKWIQMFREHLTEGKPTT